MLGTTKNINLYRKIYYLLFINLPTYLYRHTHETIIHDIIIESNQYMSKVVQNNNCD